MTITARRLSASLLVVLAACNLRAEPKQAIRRPRTSEDTGDDSVPGSDVAFSVDCTKAADGIHSCGSNSL